MRIHLGKLLSFNAGYVDTASFLALHGLFAAHVTGNFVTLGAALVSDSQTGAWAKLAALPMFCSMVLLTKLIEQQFMKLQKSSYTFLLKLMLVLFTLAAVLSVFYLPFPKHDTAISFIVGMLLVAAMAIQNAMHRIHWIKESPVTPQ
ncbi:MAG: YoaK family protein [Acinetobacter sp.]